MKHDPDYILMLVQCGEISRSKARELIEGHESEVPKFEGYFGQDEVPMETVKKAKALLTPLYLCFKEAMPLVAQSIGEFLKNPEAVQISQIQDEITVVINANK